MSKKKIPSRALPGVRPSGKKVGISAQADDMAYYNRNLSWQFHRMYPCEVHGKADFWGWPALLADGDKVFAKLKDFDQLTWKDIIENKNFRDKHHLVAVANLADEPRKYIQEHERGLEKVMSLRFGSTLRLYGRIAEHGVFQALIWDREHRVYPMAD